MMSKAHVLLALAAALTLAAVGCTKYTSRGARIEQLPKGAKVAVTVIKSCDDGANLNALEGYVTAALVGKGYSVRTLRLEMLLGTAMERRLFPEEEDYTGRLAFDGLHKGLEEEGGKKSFRPRFLEKEGEEEPRPEPDGEVITEPAQVGQLLDRNEVVDASRRFGGIVDLVGEFPVKWDVGYILVVHQFDTYGFASYLVHLPEKKVINSFVISGNKKGYKEGLGKPAAGTKVNASDSAGDVTRLRYLRLAEYIAANL